MAFPNDTDEPRFAHAILFVDAATTYCRKPHVVTDPLALEDGAALTGELFPAVSSYVNATGA